MEAFFNDDFDNELGDLDEFELPQAYGTPKPNPPSEENIVKKVDDGKRRITRFGTFKETKNLENPKFKSLALPMAKDEGDESNGIKWMENYMIIKEEIGRGGFCKVKAADVIVHRDGKDKVSGEKKLIKGT
jgi:hypothetical protein